MGNPIHWYEGMRRQRSQFTGDSVMCYRLCRYQKNAGAPVHG